jgi:hypothetical protein
MTTQRRVFCCGGERLNLRALPAIRVSGAKRKGSEQIAGCFPLGIGGDEESPEIQCPISSRTSS